MTGKTLTSGPRTSEKRACEHQSANRKRRQRTSSNGNQELEPNAAQTMSTKGRSVGTTPATNESLPQNDRRSFFCGTVADSNRDVRPCGASSLSFGMATEMPKS